MTGEYQTFEDYLEDYHSELFPELLDDDISDHFDNWLGTLDGDEYLEHGERYGKFRFIAGQEKILNEQLAKLTNQHV